MESRNCPHCSAINRAAVRFCTSCGKAMQPPATKTCASGHSMDPTWDECPYCARTELHQRPSPPPAAAARGEHPGMDKDLTTPVPPRTPPAAGVPPAAEMAREQPVSADPARNRKTEIAEKKNEIFIPGDGRILVGVLVTYSHHEEGQMFPVRRGRTVIGAGEDADVRIVGDSLLSAHHAVIVERPDGRWVDDAMSTNGSWLNGAPLKEKTPLQDGDVLRTGGTLWRFIAVCPPEENG